jgi:hypothetical protein
VGLKVRVFSNLNRSNYREADTFAQDGNQDELQKTREQLDELYKQIGQMKVETDW